eukprot:TCONS_00010866-protein
MRLFCLIGFWLSLGCVFCRPDLFHENDDDDGYAVCKYGPCLNGGVCTAHPDKYYCSCLPGWIGTNCERRNACFPNPCHYGICSPNMDGFTCTCKAGFKGNLCNVLDHCHPNPCHNNGLCTETQHGVQCECSPGFKGRLCEMESKCEPINPCLNGGTCREFVDHYYCACPLSFRGVNCEDYISPTKPPPTIPLKQVGPQAIPAPMNAPNSDIRDVFTYRSTDQYGNPYSETHEEIRKGPQGLVNPGASLVPHPVALAAMNEAPGTHFVGAPNLAEHGDVIMHSSREDDKAVVSTSTSEDEIKNLPENIKDDRYQTHFVEVDKDNEGHEYKHKSLSHNHLHVGESVGVGEYAQQKHAPNNDEEAGKVISDVEKHHEEIKENSHQQHDHDEHISNEKHVPQNVFVDHSYLDLPHHARQHEQSSKTFETKQTIEAQASERSKLDRPDAETSEMSKQNLNRNGSPSSDDDNKSNIKTIGDMLKMFDQATKTLSTKIIKSANKVMLREGKAPYIPQVEKSGKSNSNHQSRSGQIGNATQSPFSEMKHFMQNLYNLTNKITNINNAKSGVGASMKGVKKHALGATDDLYKHFTDHQKNAYTSWRRQALINYHARNPGKPVPRNTVSLSENSLCPKFCRLFCDPWCVKIGCCKLSQEKLNIYKEIEEKQEAHLKNTKPSGLLLPDEVEENVQTTKRQHNNDNDVTLTRQPTATNNETLNDNCRKCNENADCVQGSEQKGCVCKPGFSGDGKVCTVDTCMLCHLDAECEGERCFCKNNFEGDGYECRPLHASKRNQCSDCHLKADCTSGECVCSMGYYGNGKNCWPIPII